MATYGLDFYGRAVYGSAQALTLTQQSLTVGNFNARPYDYGQILLSWDVPQGSWTTMRLIRNRAGAPAFETDGIILLEQQPSTTGISTNYLDFDSLLNVGGFWYYALWLQTSFDVWGGSIPYQAGDRVSYSGTSYTALVANMGVTPGTLATTWAPNLSSTQNWVQTGAVTALPVLNYGYTDRMYKMIPDPYKQIFSEVTATDSVPINSDFYSFMQIFGFQLDLLKTEYDQILHGGDVNRVSTARLQDIANQFGIPLETTATGRLQRLQLQSASNVSRSRGTLVGVRAAINAATGWDADISIGPNMLLDDDQSSFVHPTYSDWRADVNYPTGERVVYNNSLYQTNYGGAYGTAQAPPAPRTSNTWWTWVDNYLYEGNDAALANATTGGISTWGPVALTSGIASSTIHLIVTVGTGDSINPQDLTRNEIFVRNHAGVTADIGVRSIAPISSTPWNSANDYIPGNYVTYQDATGRVLQYVALQPNKAIAPDRDSNVWKVQLVVTDPSIDRSQINRDGIPVPKIINAYDSTRTYLVNEWTTYSGFVYQAAATVLNVAPTGQPTNNGSWVYVRRDHDFYTASMYVAAQGSAAQGYQTTATAFIDWFTAEGGSLGRVIATANPWYLAGFDTSQGVTTHAGLTIDGGYNTTAAWTEYNGTWGRANGFAYPYAGGAARSLSAWTHLYFASGRSDGLLALTFRQAISGKETGLLFRRSDQNNFYVATRTGLWKYTAGVKSVLASWTSLVDGDRIRVILNGSSIMVAKHLPCNPDGAPALSTLANVTNTGFQTATGVGLFAEVASDAGGAIHSGSMDDFGVTDLENKDPLVSRIYNYYQGLDSGFIRVWVTATGPEEYLDGSSRALWRRGSYAAIGARWKAVPNGVFHYLDKAQFERQPYTTAVTALAPTPWTGARAINVKIRADRVNLVPNPGFNVDTTTWAGFGPTTWTIARDAAVGKSNLGSLKFTLPVHTGAYAGAGIITYQPVYPATYAAGYGTPVTGAQTWYGVQTPTLKLIPGKRYTASGWVKLDVASAPVGIAVSGIGVGSTTTSVPIAIPKDVVNGWVRLQLQFRVPVGVTGGAIQFYINHADQISNSTASAFWLDDVMLEASDNAGDYFDADFSGVDYLWGGTSNASESRFYRGRRAKQYRLDDIIKSAIPLGASYTIAYSQD